MPIWTLRLIACAGFVALLSRLPALDSTTDALLLGAAVGALALAAHLGPVAWSAVRGVFRHGRFAHPFHPALRPHFRSAHGADA